MNATTINLIAIIVLGLVALAAIAAYAHGKRSGDNTLIAALGPYQAIAQSLVARFDIVLAQYGDVLKPVNNLATATATLFDEPTDFAVKLLPEDVAAIANDVIKYIVMLTDGKPPVETIPPIEGAPMAEEAPKL